jgi:uncharacterized Zn finger protein
MSKRSGRNSGSSAGLPHFEEHTLREFAGDKVFARGAAYHANGQVEIGAVTAGRLFARVMGSEIYAVRLDGTGRDFSGECTCPAFADRGFCKHLVATALAANATDPAELAAASSRFERIRGHLRAKGVDGLVEMIIGLAESNPELLKELELSVAVDTDDDKAVFTRFKKAITDATRMRDYVEYRFVREWAKGIDKVLDRMEVLLEHRAEVVRRLLEYFFARMDEALQSIDDSDGYGGALYARSCEMHLAACRKAKPEPVALARDLFAREMASDWDFFTDASQTYARVLGKPGLAEYHRLASEAWKKLKPTRPRRGGVWDEESSTRRRLNSILERFAERESGLDGRIAMRAKNLVSPYDYMEIARMCLENKREAEALKWAEEGLWQFEDDPDEQLIVFTADLRAGAGRKDDAAVLLWQVFDRAPGERVYEKLKLFGRSTTGSVRERAIAILKTKLGKPSARQGYWSSIAELLIEILLEGKSFAEAWSVALAHGCSDELLETLAKLTEESHPSEVLAAFRGKVEQLIVTGGRENYVKTAKFIARMQKIRRRLNKSGDHTAYLADLMTRHKARRNFIKLLPSKANI